MKSLHWCGVAVVLFALACDSEPRKITITGKITRDGNPYTPTPDTYVTIKFVPAIEGGGNEPTGTFKHADGSYTIDVFPGKYRHRVMIVEPAKKTGKGDPKPVGPKQTLAAEPVDFTTAREYDIAVPK